MFVTKILSHVTLCLILLFKQMSTVTNRKCVSEIEKEREQFILTMLLRIVSVFIVSSLALTLVGSFGQMKEYFDDDDNNLCLPNNCPYPITCQCMHQNYTDMKVYFEKLIDNMVEMIVKLATKKK